MGWRETGFRGTCPARIAAGDARRASAGPVRSAAALAPDPSGSPAVARQPKRHPVPAVRASPSGLGGLPGSYRGLGVLVVVRVVAIEVVVRIDLGEDHAERVHAR